MARTKTNKGLQIHPKSAILVIIAVFLSILASVSSIDDKCAACNVVAGELEIGLANEKPRNHLDMRHRLDSKGQREGKVIDYSDATLYFKKSRSSLKKFHFSVSELRVVELLDGLCEKVQDYTMKKFDSGKQEWIKVRDWDNLKSDKQEARAYSKQISSFCGRLMEETEDELAEGIKRGSIQTGGVSKALCQDLSKYCTSMSAPSGIDDNEL